MSERLHLRPIPAADSASKPDAVFLVVRRENGHFSPAAKVMAVFNDERDAESEASRLHEQYPSIVFGVFALRSEARTKPVITELARIGDQQ